MKDTSNTAFMLAYDMWTYFASATGALQKPEASVATRSPNSRAWTSPEEVVVVIAGDMQKVGPSLFVQKTYSREVQFLDFFNLNHIIAFATHYIVTQD